MLNESEAQEVLGRTVYSGEGEKIGKVGQVFLDDQTGRPEFVPVNTGLFGTSESFVPVQGASLEGEDVSVPYSKAQIKDAPRVDLDGDHLEQADEDRLFAYYDSAAGAATNAAGPSGHDTLGHEIPGHDGSGHDSPGHDTSGPDTDDAMTRSEEHLSVGTASREAGRARLRKYMTTETETETETVEVPVRKERAVLEIEPVTGSNLDDATSGPDISEEEHEVVLNEERVVVDKVAEPVERVRLGTETVTEQETVSDEVRKEHIELDGDVDDRR
ncbi:MAG: PRC-barrel domain protein [Marmoricola sp.]|nr:PRC-barrel domain protein [Marmoricola sp.]